MINLLPPQQQEELKQYRVKKVIIVLGFIGTVFLASLALVLLTLNIHLRGEVNYQNSVLEARKGESKTGQIDSIQDKFTNYNKRIAKLQSFYEEQDHPSDFLEEVNSELPSSVYLTSLSYRKTPKKEYKAEVRMTGYCPSRETLFELKERIDEKSEWKNLKLPPSNWVEAEDINFELNFQLKDESK